LLKQAPQAQVARHETVTCLGNHPYLFVNMMNQAKNVTTR